MLTNTRMLSALMLLAATLIGQGAVLAQEPTFKLGVEQNTQLDPAAGFQGYPQPKMIPQTPVMAPPKHVKPIKAKIEHNVEPPRQQPMRPIQAAIQTAAPIQGNIQQQAPPPGVLPQQFLGRWQVMGSRANVQARPEYQGGIENIFTATNSQTWNIVGGGGGYSMSSDTGVNQVQVGNCTASIAYIRYAHPIKNTVAQEAIVLQLSPDGRSFQGKQRISIVKQGEGAPRAQVTYNLMGYRQ